MEPKANENNDTQVTTNTAQAAAPVVTGEQREMKLDHASVGAAKEPEPLPPAPDGHDHVVHADAEPPAAGEHLAKASKPPIGARVLYSFDDTANKCRRTRPADVVQVNDDGTLDLFVLFHPHDRHCGLSNNDPKIVLKVSHNSDRSVEEDFYHRCWSEPSYY